MNSFERDPLVLLNDVARLLRTKFDQRARAFGMTRAQWMILARLVRQPGISQNELASMCEVEPITVGRLIDRLEMRGMVERRPDPSDRRIRRLHLLPAAQAILDEIARYRDEYWEIILAGVDKAAQENLVNALIRMKINLTTETADAAKLAAGG